MTKTRRSFTPEGRLSLINGKVNHANYIYYLSKLSATFTMKQLMCLAIVTFLLIGCELKVEIPNKHAGVVITNDQEVENEVLRPGEHIVRTNSRVILYDVNYEVLEIEFDVLFKDVSTGDLTLKIEFTPVVDSLPGFYRKYQSIYIGPVIDSKSRSTVRNLLRNYNPAAFSKDEFRMKIIEALTSNYEIANYVEVHKVEIMNLRR